MTWLELSQVLATAHLTPTSSILIGIVIASVTDTEILPVKELLTSGRSFKAPHQCRIVRKWGMPRKFGRGQWFEIIASDRRVQSGVALLREKPRKDWVGTSNF